jgi:hypothetical protein
MKFSVLRDRPARHLLPGMVLFPGQLFLSGIIVKTTSGDEFIKVLYLTVAGRMTHYYFSVHRLIPVLILSEERPRHEV